MRCSLLEQIEHFPTGWPNKLCMLYNIKHTHKAYTVYLATLSETYIHYHKFLTGCAVYFEQAVLYFIITLNSPTLLYYYTAAGKTSYERCMYRILTADRR